MEDTNRKVAVWEMDKSLFTQREKLLAGEGYYSEWILDVEEIIEVKRGGKAVL